MAALVKNGEMYGLIWSDRDRRPIQVRESLRTSKKHLALRKKKQLEWGYENRNNKHFPDDEKHDPWVRKWYEDKRRPDIISIQQAIEEFIAYKTSARGEEGWGPRNAVKEAFVMRMFGRIMCMDPAMYRKWEKGKITKAKAMRAVKDRPLSDVTKEDLERVYYRPGVTSDHTRNSDYISLNTFFNWCIERGYVKEKPIFKPRKPQSKVPKFIYPEELAQLIQCRLEKAEAVKRSDKPSPLWIPLGWLVLAGTGMRPIEVAHLKVQHVEQGSIIIGEDFAVKVLSERRIPLLFEADLAVQILTDPGFRKRQRMEEDYLLGWKPDYTKQELSRDFSDYWKKRFPKKSHRTLYNLKDMYAVRFLTDPDVPSPSGLRLNDLKEILGHASLETTQKYLKAIPFGTKIEGTVWGYDPDLSHFFNLLTGSLHDDP